MTALLALSLLAAACSSDKKTTTSSSSSGQGNSSGGGALATTAGFDGTTIKLGVITPQTGPVKLIGDPLTNGNRVWFDYVNKELGGIAGKYKVELEVVDSAYDATKGVQQYNAIKGDVVMFAQILGTPVVNAVLSQLKRDGLAGQPATLDSLWVREPNLVPIGTPYQIQAINSMSWYLGEPGNKDKKVCTAIQDDPYGKAGQSGIDFAAKEMGFTVATTAKFGATDTSFTAQVSQLKTAGCEVIFLVATPTTTGGLLGAAAAGGYAPQWIGQSPTFIGILTKSPLVDYLEKNYVVASEGVTWGDESVPGMKDLVARQKKYAADQAPDYYFVFGYNEARAVTQVLEKAVALGDLSHDGILKAITSLDKLTFDGLTGDYGYGPVTDRNPPRVNTIFKVDRNAPGGLAVLKAGIESDAAKKFTFAG